jgi:hypothetical protein
MTRVRDFLIVCFGLAVTFIPAIACAVVGFGGLILEALR